VNRKPCTQDVLDLLDGLSGVVAELEGRVMALEARQRFPQWDRFDLVPRPVRRSDGF
jgi:hypothetical protein